MGKSELTISERESFGSGNNSVNGIVDRFDSFHRAARVIHEGEAEVTVYSPDFGDPGVGREGPQALEGVTGEILRDRVPLDTSSLVRLRRRRQTVFLVA